MELVYYCKL